MPRYKKGDIRYYKNIFKLNYEPVTILDIRTIYHYFDPYLGPTIKYEYLIKFKNGRIKSVKEERLF